ncbi:hypothetical protein BHU72_11450 [Desulfuribacillus stibiiarsenatis]|uniref:Na/Pi cotransporter n=1 Tax=Desulfuribacillus stibiiarsenatis TaxID=1390249 RepID=A0A1E5L837_9FIRM|nr:Na/Pi symporter [Desulfuribacillus stibiiarsenatis]OEH86149.1 hypothetical protein BHU72_11450 [Desulfuribacillus stibiiarsenatis]
MSSMFAGIILLFVGLTCFLCGLFVMRWALCLLLHSHTKNLLSKLSNSPIKGLMLGVLLTAILQSSSVVLVLIINFVSIGVLPLANGIAIVLGANLGTTLTLELIAMTDTTWILICLLFTCCSFVIPRYRLLGTVTFGLALIFIGFYFMKQNASVITNFDWLVVPFHNSSNSVYALMFGIIFTAIVQSSTAATAFAMSLVESNVITLLSGILIVYGSNIGTCMTAIIAAIGASVHAKKIMAYHILVNFLSVVLLLPCVAIITDIITLISSSPSQQIAHSQVLFNLLTIAIFYPMIHHNLRWLERLNWR